MKNAFVERMSLLFLGRGYVRVLSVRSPLGCPTACEGGVSIQTLGAPASRGTNLAVPNTPTWRPPRCASSPFARSYDPRGVPRMRSQGRRGPEAHYASSQTLDRLAASPVDRYTSDGDPAVVSFPKALAHDFAPISSAVANPY